MLEARWWGMEPRLLDGIGQNQGIRTWAGFVMVSYQVVTEVEVVAREGWCCWCAVRGICEGRLAMT